MTRNIPCSIPEHHPAFAGHFPGSPIFPGVLLLDNVIHAIGAEAGQALARCELRAVKFLSPARPGDALTLQYQLESNSLIRFEILNGNRKIAVGEFVANAERPVA